MKKNSLVMILICLISMCIFAGCKKGESVDTADKTKEGTTVKESMEKNAKEDRW